MWRSLVIVALLVLLAPSMTGCGASQTSQPGGKFVVILQAGTESHEGLARALHALLYSSELLGEGNEVVLIFDGAGTEWAAALRQADHKLHGRYQALVDAGVVEEICDFCAGAFEVKEELSADESAPLLGGYEGHPSLAKWTNQGYAVIVL